MRTKQLEPFKASRLAAIDASQSGAMAKDSTEALPDFALLQTPGGLAVALSGAWTLAASGLLEAKALDLVARAKAGPRVVLDLGRVSKLDTAGAWLINRAARDLSGAKIDVSIDNARPEHQLLLKEAKIPAELAPAPSRGLFLVDLLSDIGRSLVRSLRDVGKGVAFLGEIVAGVARAIVRPSSFRMTSLTVHLENFGLRSVPIILLINFLVGAIVAQQGIFQLRRFGAVTLAVDLIGILVLRELGVLLTSIMVAGRSGSSITAELGSMKMREEVDALRVMGLSPIDVLVVPRVLALTLAVPMLTFLGDMAALVGGMLVTWSYGSISPRAFLSLLQEAVALNTFMVGLIKAPFMALEIGVISTMDGLATRGSAESLGRQVTSSVVKSIFMVIVVDGFFAVFFAGIHY